MVDPWFLALDDNDNGDKENDNDDESIAAAAASSRESNVSNIASGLVQDGWW